MFDRFHGDEKSILKISIYRRSCKIPSLKFEQQIPLFFCLYRVLVRSYHGLNKLDQKENSKHNFGGTKI